MPVVYLVNILKTTELGTLKGSLLYVNYLTNGKEERGRETNSCKKNRLTPDFIHSLDRSCMYTDGPCDFQGRGQEYKCKPHITSVKYLSYKSSFQTGK